ncbi:hypothetical protein Pcinc_033302 [Petrolisthes cinctipes]|uniref:G-protein coupled receptors family 1 profile domain-containing protein n=1 Tax=Petrolisthes cinctipes TaxID=88211 RepID=A0AAE1JZ04_PETCI|nr:hypothetical protein Pcinc_033302 [Petrolisthes cinctipes]
MAGGEWTVVVAALVTQMAVSIITGSVMTISSPSSSLPKTIPTSDHEGGLRLKCASPTAMELVQEAAGTNVTMECLELVCSQSTLVPLVDNPGTGQVTYWLQGQVIPCYIHLPSSITVGVGKMAALTPKANVVLLWPQCVQTPGVARLQATPSLLAALPPTCLHILCHIGLELYSLSAATSILIPRPSLSTIEKKECFQALKTQTQHHITPLPVQSVIMNMTQGPKASPCPTIVIVAKLREDQQVFLVMRGWWCSPLSVAHLREIVLTWPAHTHTGLAHHLYSCLLDKSRLWPSVYNHYLTFLHDLLHPNLTISNLLLPCVTIICHPNTDVSFVTQGGNLTRLWFPYLASCLSSPCLTLHKKLIECQTAISAGREVTGDSFIMLPLPHPGPPGRSALIVSTEWWCYEGSGEDSLGRSRADLVAGLAMEGKPLQLRACKELVCHANIHDFSSHTTLVALTNLSSHYFDFCLSFATTSYHNHHLTVFSLTLSTLQKQLLFLVGKHPLDLTTQQFLATLHTSSLLHLTTCCPQVPLKVSRFIFINQSYYNCYSSFLLNTPHTCTLEDHQMWFKKQLAPNTYFTVLNTMMVPFRLRLLFQWLASLIAVNKTTINYLLNKDVAGSTFRDNIIYVLREENPASPGLTSFVSDLVGVGMMCSSSLTLTLCHSTPHFPAPQMGAVVIVVLHQCFVSLDDNDSVLMLVLTQLRNTSLDEVAVCGGNNTMVMAPQLVKQVVYSSRGSQQTAEAVVQELRLIVPDWTWLADESGQMWDFITYGWCLQLQQLHHAKTVLDRTTTCMYYTIYNTTLFIGPKKKVSYHALIFPLTHPLHSPPIFPFPSKCPAPQILPLVGTSHMPPTTLQLQELSSSPVQIRETADPKDLIQATQITVKTMMTATLLGDQQCLQDLQHGKFTVTRLPHILLVGPVETDLVESSCLLSLPEYTLVQMLVSQHKRNLTTINKFWPTCGYNLVVVMGAGTGMVLDWDYLSPSCKATEFLLLTCAITIIMVNLIGNLMVLVVILATSLIQEATFLLRASLATADLLLGMVPCGLAVYDHVALITGHLALHHLAPDTLHASFARLASRQSPGFKQLRFERGGFPMVSGTIFSTSIMVSVLTLMVLSLERLSVVAGRPIHHRLVVMSIGVSWMVGVLLSILIHWRQDGFYFAGYFDPITKLTISVGEGAPSVSLAAFYIKVGVVGVAAGVVVVSTVITLCLLHHKEWRTQNKLRVHCKSREKERKQATLVFLGMVLMCVVGCVLLLLDMAADLPNTHPLSHYLAWWLFLAMASSNWALYSFTGGKFRKNLATLLKQ